MIISSGILTHDDVIKWKHFPRYWPFVRGIHRSPVNSTHKGQWRGALMLPLICVWTNAWVSNRDAGDLRRYRVHYDVTVMSKDLSLTAMTPWISIIAFCVMSRDTGRDQYKCTWNIWGSSSTHDDVMTFNMERISGPLWGAPMVTDDKRRKVWYISWHTVFCVHINSYYWIRVIHKPVFSTFPSLGQQRR